MTIHQCLDKSLRTRSRRHGPFRSVWETGQVAEEGAFARGERSGVFLKWHRNGRKKSEGAFEDGREVGHWTYWHDNGMRKMAGSYDAGRKTGAWDVWDRQNVKIERAIYEAGMKLKSVEPERRKKGRIGATARLRSQGRRVNGVHCQAHAADALTDPASPVPSTLIAFLMKCSNDSKKRARLMASDFTLIDETGTQTDPSETADLDFRSHFELPPKPRLKRLQKFVNLRPGEQAFVGATFELAGDVGLSGLAVDVDGASFALDLN